MNKPTLPEKEKTEIAASYLVLLAATLIFAGIFVSQHLFVIGLMLLASLGIFAKITKG